MSSGRASGGSTSSTRRGSGIDVDNFGHRSLPREGADSSNYDLRHLVSQSSSLRDTSRKRRWFSAFVSFFYPCVKDKYFGFINSYCLKCMGVESVEKMFR
jgi:hypothetical protein